MSAQHGLHPATMGASTLKGTGMVRTEKSRTITNGIKIMIAIIATTIERPDR
jgi:hypothetical protein